MKLTDEQINLFLARRPLTPEAQKAAAEAAANRRLLAEACQHGETAIRQAANEIYAQDAKEHPDPKGA